MIVAKEFDANEDLRPLSQFLWSQGIAHRISEQSGRQVVWAENQSQATRVQQAILGYETAVAKGELSDVTGDYRGVYDAIPLGRINHSLASVPVVAGLIFFSLVATAFLYTQFSNEAYAWLRVGSPAYIVESWEVWRLVSPIFLHFSLMHLAFNLLLLWVFGQQIERRISSGGFLLMVLVFAAISNITQYWVTGSNFGGMSGVVYGILGYCWLWGQLRPQTAYTLPNAMMGLMLGWLLLGFTDVTEIIGFGRMANGAHLSGLMLGLVAAFFMSQFSAKQSR